MNFSVFVNLIIPPIIIVIAVALLIVFLARVIPKSEDRIEKQFKKQNSKGNFFNKLKNKGEFNSFSLSKNSETNLKDEREMQEEQVIKEEESSTVQIIQNQKENFFDFKKLFNKLSFRNKSKKVDAKLPSYSQVDGIKQYNPLDNFLPKSNGNENISRMGEILISNNGSNNKSNSSNSKEESVLVRQISINPRNPESYRRLGDFYVESDRLTDARECYKYVLRLDPKHKRAQLAMKRLDRILG